MKKYKLKTRKGVAKRFRLTKSGKIKHGHAFRSHILSKKSSKRKRRLGRPAYVASEQEGDIKKLLPYG